MNFGVCGDLIILSDHEGQILLCQNKKTQAYFLPGISIDFGIPVKDQLENYVAKLIPTPSIDLSFVSVFEDIYNYDKTAYHDYHFIFKITNFLHAPETPDILKDCEWHDIALMRALKFEPSGLQHDLIEWLKGNETYFSSNKE